MESALFSGPHPVSLDKVWLLLAPRNTLGYPGLEESVV